MPDVAALAIFHGPQAYEAGRVAPTWNYVAVHAHGPLRTFEDPQLLEQHLRTLTNLQEELLPEPWSVDDAPVDFFHGQMTGIIGIEIQIARLEGKWKVSQNRSAADREGTARGLAQRPGSDAADMAVLVAGTGLA